MPDFPFEPRPTWAPAAGQGLPASASCAKYLASAEAALQAGRITEAEDYCRKILAIDSRHLHALLLFGNIAARTGKAPEGIRCLRDALAIEPDNPDALNGLAFLLRATGQVDEAIALCKRALDLNPFDIGAYLNLGACQLTQQRPFEASETFAEALDLQPDLAVLHYNLGLAMQQQGRNDEAETAYRRAIELGPSVRDPHFRHGQVLLAKGNRKEALEAFKRASQLGPPAQHPNLQLGRLLAEEGMTEEAEEYVRKAVSVSPNAPNTHAVLGDVLIQRGHFEEAIDCYEHALSLEPKLLGPYVGIVQARKVAESDRPLLDRITVLLREENPGPIARAALHYTLGKAFNDLGEYERALKNYDEANLISQKMLEESGKAFDRNQHEALFDLIIRTFTKEFFESHKDLGSSSDVPILICGMARSGTTLVEQIVSSHPKVGAGGELGYWGGKWQAVLQDAAADDLSRPRLDQLAASYLSLLHSIAPESEKVTDKMTENYMRLGSIHLIFPKVKIIYCRRHAVDNSLSIFMNNFNNPPVYVHDRENIVFTYEQHLRIMEHWNEVLPRDTMMTVDYEQMVDDREGMTRKIIEFAGLDWDDACLHHEENKREIRTASLWQARQPVYKTSVERWRRYEPWLGAFCKLLKENPADGKTGG